MPKELFIPDGTIIKLRSRRRPLDAEIICLERDFDIVDYDFASHFRWYKSLKEFTIRDEAGSSFFTQQGCLYKKVRKQDTSSIMEICGYLPGDLDEGCVLICCPQKSDYKDIILPTDCVSIAGEAFYGCNLESITIPDSIITTAIAAFTDVHVKTLYVPNKYIDMDIDHNNISEDVAICSNDPLVTLDQDVEKFWRMGINETIWENDDTEWWHRIKDKI